MTEPHEIRFTLSPNGSYMQHYPHGRELAYSQKKLCFVATDQKFLIGLLQQLGARDDCYYVKYSIEPRDGMYLGRCFLTTDEAVAQLTVEYKAHPRLMTTVQDDDFFNPYR